MKLQIGSSIAKGEYKQADWVNLDLFARKGVNVVGSGFELPFKADSFDEIHCIHVLEHLTRDKYPLMLREMARVIKPGCPVFVETPDFRGTVKRLTEAFEAQDTVALHVWTTSTYGKNEIPGMQHHWGFYEGLLRKAMREAGFDTTERIHGKENMISFHHRHEPILLVRGEKDD